MWASVARRANGGARLVVRFGALPSYPLDPKEVLVDSIEDADAGWRVKTIRCAGEASDGKRQALQFQSAGEVLGNEIDLYARLET